MLLFRLYCFIIFIALTEFVEFWLNAIHECSRKYTGSTDGKQESTDMDDTGPPVILVGTFADKFIVNDCFVKYLQNLVCNINFQLITLHICF
jgi:hypothetical protein